MKMVFLRYTLGDTTDLIYLFVRQIFNWPAVEFHYVRSVCSRNGVWLLCYLNNEYDFLLIGNFQNFKFLSHWRIVTVSKWEFVWIRFCTCFIKKNIKKIKFIVTSVLKREKRNHCVKKSVSILIKVNRISEVVNKKKDLKIANIINYPVYQFRLHKQKLRLGNPKSQGNQARQGCTDVGSPSGHAGNGTQQCVYDIPREKYC